MHNNVTKIVYKNYQKVNTHISIRMQELHKRIYKVSSPHHVQDSYSRQNVPIPRTVKTEKARITSIKICKCTHVQNCTLMQIVLMKICMHANFSVCVRCDDTMEHSSAPFSSVAAIYLCIIFFIRIILVWTERMHQYSAFLN